jgi:hypothetical protein
MGGVALAAAALAVAAGIQRRGESFRRLAAYHLQASHVLIDEAGGPLSCGTGLSGDDIEEIFCGRGPKECRAYRTALYHDALSEKYRLASMRPWLPIASDPPTPPGAHPRFEPDPRYVELVAEDSDTGFQ